MCITGEVQYLQYWMKMIQHLRDNKQLVSFDKLRRLILDAYNLLQKMLKRGEDYHVLVPLINELEGYLSKVKRHMKDHPKYS